MRHTLVDYVESKKKEMRFAAGSNKKTTQPKVPGQQTVAPGAPGTMSQTPPPPGGGLPQLMDKSQFNDPEQKNTMVGKPPMPGQKPQQQMGPMQGKPGMDDTPGSMAPKVSPEQLNSPAGQAATHVAQHVQDPLGATHQMFQNLGQKKLDYEMEKQNAVRSLLPVKAVLDHVNQMHGLIPDQMAPNPDQNQGYQDPNNPNPQPGGNPPGMGMGPGIPGNMAQQPGAMQMNKPAAAGNNPGASAKPGAANANAPEQTQRPPKTGMAKPGGPTNGQNSPQPPGSKGKPGGGKKVSVSVEGNAIRPRTTSISQAMKAANLNAIGIPRGTGGGSVPIGPVGPEPITKTPLPVTRPTGGGGGGFGGHMPMPRPSGMVSRLESKKKKKMEARDFSEGHRKSLAKKGEAMPGGSFPIVNKQDLSNAKRAIGRASNPAAAKRWINKRAKQMGQPGVGQMSSGRRPK